MPCSTCTAESVMLLAAACRTHQSNRATESPPPERAMQTRLPRQGVRSMSMVFIPVFGGMPLRRVFLAQKTLRRVFFYKKEGAESLRIFIDKENAFDRFLFLEERRGRLSFPFLYKTCAGKRSRRARRPFCSPKKAAGRGKAGRSIYRRAPSPFRSTNSGCGRGSGRFLRSPPRARRTMSSRTRWSYTEWPKLHKYAATQQTAA